MDTMPYGQGGVPLTTTTSPTSPAATHRPVTATLFDVGIFKDTIAPSLGLQSSLALFAYAAGRATDRAEAKDWLWPSGQVLNAWWSAVGRRVINHSVPLSTALRSLSRPERLILAGVTLWGARLFYRIASRSIRRGEDDARYAEEKKRPGFWNRALFSMFLPEAVIQTVIALPFTVPFRHQGAVLTGYHPWVQMAAVGVWGTGFAMEVLADWQLERHKYAGKTDLLREGVWSISRHPKYAFLFPSSLFRNDRKSANVSKAISETRSSTHPSL